MCGIAGIINQKPTAFDFATFCNLGIANDRRGGDSCGVFIDGKVEYGIDKTKLFEDFMFDSRVLFNTRVSQIALLHCRKASVGLKTKDQAQPVVIYDKENNPIFVVIHNGTIYNYEELAKKYIPTEDIKGLTDSQVMARIFFHSGYGVLKEYQGGSVFVIVDYRDETPEVLLFKGASKTSTVDKELTEERPLYVAIDEEKNQLTFSSILSNLFACRYWIRPESVKPNILYKFTGQTLHAEAVYERRNVLQSKPITTYYYPNYNSYYSTGSASHSTTTCIYWNKSSLKFTHQGVLCHGPKIIGRAGMVYSTEFTTTKKHWFFNGVLLKDKSAYDSLTKAWKKSGQEISEFVGSRLCQIAYLSEYKVYMINGRAYKATGPQSSVMFTGSIKPLGESFIDVFSNGYYIRTSYDSDISFEE